MVSEKLPTEQILLNNRRYSPANLVDIDEERDITIFDQVRRATRQLEFDADIMRTEGDDADKTIAFVGSDEGICCDETLLNTSSDSLLDSQNDNNNTLIEEANERLEHSISSGRLSVKSKSFDSILNGTLSDSDSEDSNELDSSNGMTTSATQRLRDTYTAMEKSSSLNKLDTVVRRKFRQGRNHDVQQRPASMHLTGEKTEDLFASVRLAGRDLMAGMSRIRADTADGRPATDGTTTAMVAYAAQRRWSKDKILRQSFNAADDMFRRAVSLCDVASVKDNLKENLRNKVRTTLFISHYGSDF